MALFNWNTNPNPSPLGGFIIQCLVVAVVLWIIFTYLIPLLAAPLSTIAVVVIVILVIVWLLRVAGMV
jgi:hypothetical protein